MLFAGVRKAAAQLPVITSFSQNGVLVCSNLQAGSLASVQWASSLSGPWETNWASLAAVAADANGAITVSVPMFYRVLGVAATAPAGMALIPAGAFTMGNSIADSDITDANPTNVYVSAFYMDTNLVSLSQWQGVYSYATSIGYTFYAGTGKAANHPVQTIDWYDCVKWCNARSQQAGLTPVYYTDAGFTQVYTNWESYTVYPNWAANGYRLPTEAEWEKAARGGLSGQRFPWGDIISETNANYDGNTSFSYDLGPSGYNAIGIIGGAPYTSPVGTFAPNGYELYDMVGNVLEWCWDWYAPPPYPVGSPYLGGTNPTGAATGTARVQRGGNWAGDARSVRTAYRGYNLPAYGFDNYGLRCVRSF